MQRISEVAQIMIQLENAYQPPQFGAPVLMTEINVVKDGENKPIYQPSFITKIAVPSDITDELVAVLNERLAAIGLTVARKTT